jgi:hypothetical protein
MIVEVVVEVVVEVGEGKYSGDSVVDQHEVCNPWMLMLSCHSL